jgi:multidrug efflux pump subunit AcrA (membrane-fusion protein)/GAF domain-containing protein
LGRYWLNELKLGMGKSKFAERPAEVPDEGADEAFWSGIEQMLADLASRAKSEPLPADFPERVLTWLHQVLGTEAEAFWLQDLNGRLRREGLSETEIPEQDDVVPASGAATGSVESNFSSEREALIKTVLARGEAGTAPLEAGTDGDARNGHTGDARHRVWLLAPIRSEGGAAAVIEVLHDRRSGPDEKLALEVLQSVAELCTDYLRRHQLQEYARLKQDHDEVAQFTRRIHDSLDLVETAYAIANEGRLLIGCDRVTVLACRGSGCETLGISGAARWDRRSNSVVRLEKLSAAVAAGGGWLDSGRGTASLPPQVRAVLHEYLEVAQVREVLVVPLARPPAREGGESKAVGVVVAEQFSGILTEEHRRKTASACTACVPALEHALVVKRIPWAGLFRHGDWRAVAGRGRTALMIVVGVALLLGAACVIPTDFEIEARGVLQPRVRRDMFAPDDGVVDELFVDHGAQVIPGERLVSLRNPQLDLDLKRVWGELQAARKRLSAIETARVEGATNANSISISAARLSGEDAELQELVASLMRQHDLLTAQEEALHVTSPIAGQVLTWDLPQLLQSRPVHRGQALLTIADPSGPWDLELEVPDRDAGYVLEARQAVDGGALRATYRLATDPGTSHPTTVDRVAQSIERTATGDPVLRVLAGVDPRELANSRPGATVLARIHCGRRSLAFVWLRDMYYAVTTRLWF